MLILLGALLGFISSAFPDLLKLFYHTRDCTHELAVMDRQIHLAKLGHTQRLEEIQIEAHASERIALYQSIKATGIKWVDALSGTVRPIITYAFFLLYTFVKVAQWRLLLTLPFGISWDEALVQIWHGEDEALFAAVMSFWFGSRALHRRSKG